MLRHKLVARVWWGLFMAAVTALPACACPCKDATPQATATQSGGADAAARSCVESGGTVATGLCCASAADFPNTCLIGACGCAPSDSHSVQVCQCDEGRCFDGKRCVAR